MQQLTPEKNPQAILVILILCAIVGLISIDIFTPSLPAITQYFATDAIMGQWSISVFMVGFSISMIISGPLADRFGRKKTLLGGYSFYLFATLIILYTESIYVFMVARFCQAVFGCFGTSIARAIAFDCYRGHAGTRMLSYISGSLTLAPMLAPIVGGLIQEYAGWHYNFMVMAGVAIAAILTLHLLPECYTPKQNKKRFAFLSGYVEILTNWHYVRHSLAASAAFAGAFVFLVGAPSVFIEQLDVSPKYYGSFFAIAVTGYLVGATCLPRLNLRYTHTSCLQISCLLLAIGALVSFVSACLSYGHSVGGYMTGLVIYEVGLGIFIPACQIRATEYMETQVATAFGLLFFIKMLVAALAGSAFGWLPGYGTISLATGMMICVVLSLPCLFISNKNNNAWSNTDVL